MTFEFFDPAGALLMFFLHLVVLNLYLTTSCVKILVFELRSGDDALQMFDFLTLEIHFCLDIIQIFDTFLYLISVKLHVFVGLGALRLGVLHL